MDRFSFHICGLTVALLVWTVGVAPAHATPAPAGPDATPSRAGQPEDRPASTRLDTIIVTASKLAESVSQTANAVTVLTQEEIAQRQTTDVFEQLREVPGMTFVSSGGRGGATSLFTRGGESDHNLILIDGVKVNRAGGAFNFNDLTTLGVGRIEVVRGPQSALYGSDAMSSVIQLLTPRGQGPAGATLSFRAGNPDTFEERAGVSGGTSQYGYNLAIERVDSEGLLSLNNDFSNTTVAARFDLDPHDALQLTTTVR